MRQALVIVTWAGNLDETLPPLLTSLERYHKVPIVVVVNEAKLLNENVREFLNNHYILLENKEDLWECGAIYSVLKNTDFDEFILLQDTMIVINPTVFNVMFDMKDTTVTLGKEWRCYLGKYRRKVLEKLRIPKTTTKLHSMVQEVALAYFYIKAATDEPYLHYLCEDWGDDNPNNKIVEFYGRKNLVLDNPYILKYKATVATAKEGAFATTNITWEELTDNWNKTGDYFN
jgi:hypothetical protein